MLLSGSPAPRRRDLDLQRQKGSLAPPRGVGGCWQRLWACGGDCHGPLGWSPVAPERPVQVELGEQDGCVWARGLRSFWSRFKPLKARSKIPSIVGLYTRSSQTNIPGAGPYHFITPARVNRLKRTGEGGESRRIQQKNRVLGLLIILWGL